MKRISTQLYQKNLKNKIKKIRRFFARCDDTSFLQLAWAVNILQSDLLVDVRKFIEYPIEANTSNIADRAYIYKWEIETLVNFLLTTQKQDLLTEGQFFYNCLEFNTISAITNLLRSAEDSEAKVFVSGNNIFLELHRIGHRQFEWQRGFDSLERLYRYAYIYGQGDCSEYFYKKHKITISDLMHVGFLLSAALQHSPRVTQREICRLGVDSLTVERALLVFSRTLRDLKKEARAINDKFAGIRSYGVAYLPSIIRRFPLVKLSDESYTCPLHQIIYARMTSGIYYDICDGPQELLRRANLQFESYCAFIISKFFPKFKILPKQKYGSKKLPRETPDVVVAYHDKIELVIECKSAKLTYEAQFSDAPFERAIKGYSQIVDGIIQIWKFFSDSRRRLHSYTFISENAIGVLLTMDSWMQLSGDLQRQAVEQARKTLEGNPDIIISDMRPVVFCSIQELIDVMIRSDDDAFIRSMRSASEERFIGWRVPEVFREAGDRRTRRKLPINTADLLPWLEKYRKS